LKTKEQNKQTNRHTRPKTWDKENKQNKHHRIPNKKNYDILQQQNMYFHPKNINESALRDFFMG